MIGHSESIKCLSQEPLLKMNQVNTLSARMLEKMSMLTTNLSLSVHANGSRSLHGLDNPGLVWSAHSEIRY